MEISYPCLYRSKIFFQGKEMIDADQQEVGYGREQTETPNDNQSSSHDDRVIRKKN